ncbi:DNA primase, phage associated [hydrothermal vent metagenome]|uniref:DNA primase, phage associated n=1 Tax=hydrothermal vent metagenome TaxID=652676 RepID=A0A3B0RU55_9ZZZZ
MGRIPDNEIERLKQDVSLVRLAESAGITFKKHGKDYLGHCPFHDDKTPSLVISPEKNLWHCLGACNEGGSVIDWVMKRERVSFRHAVDLLRNDDSFLAADIADAKAKPVKHSPSLKRDTALVATADEQALLTRVIDFYHETLKQSPEALAYLDSRGLHDVELINTFKLGYANRSLAYRLPPKKVKAGAEIRRQLQAIGLYRDSGHEHFNGSLVIPVMSITGDIGEVYGRKLLSNLRKGTPKHLYLPGPHQGVFNPVCLGQAEIILCESLIDALTFWRHGFRNVTTSYGTAGFTDEILKSLTGNHIARVLIAYDRDEAGNTAAGKAAETLLAAGIDCYRLLFPKGMDANDYALKMSPARKSLELVIRKAEWMGAGEKPQGPSIMAPLTIEPSVMEPSTIATKEEISEAETLSSLAADLVVDVVADIPASPQPENPHSDIPAEVTDNEVVMHFGNRRYRVRGLKKAMSYEQLKINLCATDDNEQMHIDHIDLYHAKQRQSFIKQACVELDVTDEVIKKDLAKVLLKLEQLQDAQIQDAVKPKENIIALSHADQQHALDLLRDPDLLNRILADFDRAGVVGEETNKLVGYLAAVSRKLMNPLAVVIQSTSAAGKSALMNAVLAMMPEEEKIQYSAMTGQSLFYMGETDLKHKILAIAEEEGAEQASYALKLLQSEGELTIASTGKDADGNLTTQEYRVEGPVMLFSTTTAIDIDEELMNRCVVLTVNESREQTRLIHELQRKRETLQGLLAQEDKKAILQLHQNAQRLLKPMRIVNPYAPQLTFMDNQTRSRRDHMKYLQLIKTITLLHQYQRDIQTVQHNGKTLNYIEVSKADIATANRLAHEVLGRSLDELPPQTRKLLEMIYDLVQAACKAEHLSQPDYRFSRKQVREYSRWSDFQIKKHMQRLEELEYVLIHSGSRGKSINYELLYRGEARQQDSFVMGLINPDDLRYDKSDDKKYDNEKEPLNPEKKPPSRPQSAPKSPPGSTSKNTKNPINTDSNADTGPINGKRTSGSDKKPSSHRSHTSISLTAESGVTV